MKKGKSDSDNKVTYGTVSLPTPLINIIKERIKGTGMQSVSAYVSYVLRQVLSYDESTDVMSKDTEEDVRKRLKNLGY